MTTLTQPLTGVRLLLLRIRLALRRDGLCHAYAEYDGLDCLRPKHHGGFHGDPEPPRRPRGSAAGDPPHTVSP